MLARLTAYVVGAYCSGCGRHLREWKRGACPKCGDTRRSFERTVTEKVTSADKVA